MPTTSFEFIFHGTGCSAGVPSITCLTRKPATCETCTSAVTPGGWKNKRKNTGGIVRVRNDRGEERVLVIDVGKTFMAAAVDIFPRHDLSRIDAVLLTHGHADAINGLDDLRSWTLGEKRIQDYIDICASEDTFNDIKRGFPYLVYQGHGSGSGHVPQFKWHIIEPNKPFYLNGIDFPITAVNVHHGYLPMFQRLDPAAPDPYMCFGFILGDIMVYMSDVSHIPEEAWTRIEAAGNGYQFFVVDCLRPTKLAAHFGLKDTVDAANRINAHKTYLFGFGHEIPHDGWGAITRVIEGKNPGRVSPVVQQALDALVELGVKGRGGLRISPAYDGQHLKLVDGRILDDDS